MKNIIFIVLIGIIGTLFESKSQSIDSIIVHKSERKLLLYSKDKIYRSYKVSLGKRPVGPKEKFGDNKTPEGKYKIDSNNDKSKFHKNLGINYPNAIDKKLGRTGSEIKIHGLKNGVGWIKRLHRFRDWTAGCIAVTNKEIDEIYKLVKINTPISIYP